MKKTLFTVIALLIVAPNCSKEDEDWIDTDGCSQNWPVEHTTAEAQADLVGSGGFAPSDAVKPLYAPCDDASECESGACTLGYCTMTCVSTHDCEPDVAECVRFGDESICMPVCDGDDECAAYGCSDGVCSSCGSFSAIDGITVSACADGVETVE